MTAADLAMTEAARRLGATLIFLDLETTGTNVSTDRIVEIAIVKATADEVIRKSRLVNPGCPIPKAASDVHGVTDEMVAGMPTFRQIARGLVDFIGDATLVAFNGLKFDVPMLAAEFQRAGVDFDPEAFAVVDPFVIFQRDQPRDLAAALRHYCGVEHDGAHRGDADVDAMAQVLVAQLASLDLPDDAASLAAWCLPPDAVDRGGWFAWRDGEAVITRGKHAGVALRDIDHGFLDWMLRLPDLATSTRRVVTAALRGEFPTQPANSADEGAKEER